MKVMKGIAEKSTGQFTVGFIYHMRAIGALRPKVLAPYKPFFEGMLNNVALKEHAQNILDLIAGRTSVTSH